MVELKQHQLKASIDLVNILFKSKFAVLNAEMRVGKTYTIINTCYELSKIVDIKSVLIVTKKGAITSINSDLFLYFEDKDKKVNFEVQNYESLHKSNKYYDVIVLDECHVCGFIGKQKLVNKRLLLIKYKYKILMSGSIFTESFSTTYSLFRHLFPQHKSFYHWAKDYINIKKKRVGQFLINDYSEVKSIENIMAIIKPYMVSVTQEDAEFINNVEDVIHYTHNENIDKLCKIIKKTKMYTFKTGEIFIADSIPLEMQGIKQLQGGGLKIDEDKYLLLDSFKIDYIISKFKGKKTCIYYNYIAESMIIKKGLDLVGLKYTNIPEDFNKSDFNTVFVAQFTARREGVNLSSSNDLIFYSIPYSNLSYIQARERCLMRDKKERVFCHLLLTKFDEKVYKIIKEKKGAFNAEAYKKLRHDF